jgi:hypothetical protein
MTDERIRARGWLHDPTLRHQIRYWDGRRWTDRVSDNGRRTVDPLAEQPPAPLRPATELLPHGSPAPPATARPDARP